MTDVQSADGTRLALTTWGADDAPPVVLVHGLGMSTESWGDVADLLAEGHRVIAYDLRGHAQSGDARGADYSMPAHAQDLDAVLRECVPADRRAVVVGHSMGGAVTLAAAQLAGFDRVAGVVFAGSGGSGVTAPGLPARWLPPRLESSLRMAWFRGLRAGTLAGRRLRSVEAISNRAIRRFAFTEDAAPEHVAWMRDQMLGTRPLALAGSTFANVSQDGTRLAPGLRVPALVVHGTGDPEVPEEAARRLLDRLPDGELVEVPGAGHMLPLTHPQQVAEQVTRWVRRVGLAPSASAPAG